jgi:tRNA dimethylallyltransferase
MLAAGFLDEVRALRESPELRSHPRPLDLPALRAVGYRQAWQHLDGATDVHRFRELALFATRQLAKRQITWLRSDPALRLFDADRAGVRDRVLAAVDLFAPRLTGAVAPCPGEG